MDVDAKVAMLAANGAFAGHVRKDSVVVRLYGPNELPWVPRACAVILLDPRFPGSTCGIVDLLHPSEAGTPRCGDPDCRCMTNTKGDADG